ncbi:hypothetical protein E1263_31310 [Kribbella antibiotica]|uniref:STAS domain-containing protein n=1 Tax=Kribbella antibiotica TaxID=190195 RepID=A0A4R4YZW8_9ACTN|nr:hypothetical protein [Kribbella antibiotica]TDD50059.1 hypothetical protein E1263_31310 [Kribbella antibiotica]
MPTREVIAAGGSGLQIDLDVAGEMTIVRPAGWLSASTSADLGNTLLHCLSDQPSAVLVDLTQLRIARMPVLDIFTKAARSAAIWSGVPLLLVAQPAMARQLHAISIKRYAQVHPTMDTAIAAAEQSPPRTMTVRRLDNEPRSARTCRRHVARTCEDWGHGRLTEAAVAVSDELVGNGLRHSVGALTHRLELRRESLTVAVTDHAPAPPIPIEPAAGEIQTHGYGLKIISAHAAAWGSTPTTTGGKTVWVVLR